MRTILVKSYCKINLALKVTGKNSDGFHTLDMVMLPLELHDSILMTNLKNGVDHYVTMDDYSVLEVEDNIVTKALHLFLDDKFPKDFFKCDIHKVIPSKAGLGGGSSNGAFALKGLRQSLKCDISNDELLKMSEKLGSDVPFFIDCKPARCQGTGNIISPISVKNDYYVLIVKPDKGCSTATVYAEYDNMKKDTINKCDDVVKALETGDDELLANSIFNDLEDPATKYVPEILTIKEILKELGLKIILMTGSGSSVFAMSKDKKQIAKIAKYLYKNYDYNVYTTKVLKDRR